MKTYTKVVTGKCAGGWRVRIVDSDFLNIGDELEPHYNGIFDRATAACFNSRKAAREALKSYKRRLPCIIVIGGLH